MDVPVDGDEDEAVEERARESVATVSVRGDRRGSSRCRVPIIKVRWMRSVQVL